jgi:anti-anti-sigma regulatory factor
VESDAAVSGGLRDALRDRLQAPGEIVLDLSEVDGCDLTALQLLCAAHKSAERAGRRFRVTRASAAILETSAELGLAPADFGGVDDGGAPGVAGGL